ncbi:MAG: thiosulfate oxidation carrier protein SoxY [Pseudomonadota bacterium]
MTLTRRDTLAIGAGTALVLALPSTGFATAESALEAFTGGADVGTGGVTLTIPEIAENGNAVPISVNAPGATEIMVLALGNPVPPVARFSFGALAGEQAASTRIRLAGSQTVVAVAKMSDGSFVRDSHSVTVTVGGCGS